MHLAALLLCLLTAILAPSQAMAHATLIESSPADGALMKQAADAVVLTFNETVEPLALTLVAPGGTARRLEAQGALSEQVRILLPPALGEGTHLLSWRVVSADGHPVGGSLVFSIGRASGGATAGGLGAGELVTATNPEALILARFVMLAGVAIGIGGALFLAWLGAADPGVAMRTVLTIPLLAGLGGGLLLIGLEGLEAHGLPLSSFPDPVAWRTGLRSVAATTVLIAWAGILLAAASLRRQSNGAQRILSLLALVAVGVAMAASGHAGTAPPKWLMPQIVAVHVATVVAWLGSLLPLAQSVLRGPVAAGAGLGKFSRIALPLIAAIVLTGGALALAQAGSVEAVAASAYGRLLAAKLIAVTAVLGLAGVNRYRLTAAAARGEAGAKRWLATSILGELILAVLILGLVACWRITPPPRALVQAQEGVLQVHMHGTDAMASLFIQPARVGPVKIVIEPKTPDLAALEVKEVALSLTSELPGLEPLRREAKPINPAQWEIDGLTIPLPGRWQLRLEMLISDFERTGLDADVVVKP